MQDDIVVQIQNEIQLKNKTTREENQQKLSKLQTALTQKLQETGLDKLGLTITEISLSRYDLTGLNATEFGRASNFWATGIPDHSNIAEFKLTTSTMPETRFHATVIKQDQDDIPTIIIYTFVGRWLTHRRVFLNALSDLAQLPHVGKLLAD